VSSPQGAARAASRLRPEQLAEILDRLPAGVVVVDRQGAVRYSNTAAQRHLHPARIRIGEPLPDVASDPPLAELAHQLFRRRLLGDEVVRIGSETFAVAGAVDRSEHLASLVIDDVTVTCSENIGVLADADVFRQAVTMLVENARRHSHDGVGITVAEEGQMVAVDVVDRGAGILPENLERVTERFFSGAGRDSGGYGIGLSIAVRAAEALGGALELASDRAGTRARLKLPSARLL